MLRGLRGDMREYLADSKCSTDRPLSPLPDFPSGHRIWVRKVLSLIVKIREPEPREDSVLPLTQELEQVLQKKNGKNCYSLKN
jgi:hypothetical protein